MFELLKRTVSATPDKRFGFHPCESGLAPIALANGNDSRVISYCILASLSLHIFFAFFLFHPPNRDFSIAPLMVEIVTPDNIKKEQIVSEPQSEKSLEPPENASLLAEENHVAVKEQIARGDPTGGNGNPVSPPQKAVEKSAHKEKSHHQQKESKVAKSSSSKSKNSLTIPLSELGDLAWKDGNPETPERQRPSGRAKAAPFSRPEGTGASLFGSADLLPNLPDGDLTFLNTKASQFAVFVRRVALSVFSEIKQLGWEELTSYDVQAIKDNVEIHAILNKNGSLESVRLVHPSGSKNFDTTINSAIRSGARDSNPPPEAARPDGKFEFIFRAKSWTMLGVSRRGGTYERRWLQLETGLG